MSGVRVILLADIPVDLDKLPKSLRGACIRRFGKLFTDADGSAWYDTPPSVVGDHLEMPAVSSDGQWVLPLERVIQVDEERAAELIANGQAIVDQSPTGKGMFSVESVNDARQIPKQE